MRLILLCLGLLFSTSIYSQIEFRDTIHIFKEFDGLDDTVKYKKVNTFLTITKSSLLIWGDRKRDYEILDIEYIAGRICVNLNKDITMYITYDIDTENYGVIIFKNDVFQDLYVGLPAQFAHLRN